jgi:hypothetical protein
MRITAVSTSWGWKSAKAAQHHTPETHKKLAIAIVSDPENTLIV